MSLRQKQTICIFSYEKNLFIHITLENVFITTWWWLRIAECKSWQLVLCSKGIELPLYNLLSILLVCYCFVWDLINVDFLFWSLSLIFLMKVIRTKILSSFVLKPTAVNVLTLCLAGDLMPRGPQLGQVKIVDLKIKVNDS